MRTSESRRYPSSPPPILDESGGGPWGRLCQRVAPLLGDVRAHLGEDWHRIIDQVISREDLETVARAARGDPPPDWFIIERKPIEGLDDDCDEDERQVTEGFVDAVFHVLRFCRVQRILPTALVFDDVQQTLTLSVGARGPWMMVRPLRTRQVPQALRARAQGTVLGLRKADFPGREFVKKVKRWPGMADVNPVEPWLAEMRSPKGPKPFTVRAQRHHHSAATEWRLSALALCALCGHASPDRKLVDQVAAAAFDQPSWNHLVALDQSAATFAGPWALVEDSAEGQRLLHYYADAFDALADLLARAPKEFVKDWPAVRVRQDQSFDEPLRNTPSYSLERYVLRAERSFPVPAEHSVSANSIQKAGSRIDNDARDQKLREEVAQAMKSGGHSSIEALFGIARAASDRHVSTERWSGEVLLVAEGAWRLSASGSDLEGTQDAFLMARRFDAEGNCVEEAGVPAYKGRLLCWGSHFVLCWEPTHMPVAIVDGLSREGFLKAIRALDHQRWWQPSPEGGWPEYRRPVKGGPSRREEDYMRFERLLRAFRARGGVIEG